MTTYPFEAPLFVDAVTFTRAPNAQITIYDELDLASATPLVLTDPNGLNLANPLTSSPDAFGPNFRAPSPRVKWTGGGLTGFLSSPTAVLDEAKAARAAAESAQASAAASADLVGAPADVAVAALLQGPSQTATALGARVDVHAQDAVPPLVAQAIAADHTPADAAAAAVTTEIAKRRLVQATDPGAPGAQDIAEASGVAYVEATLDPANRMVEGIKADGTKHIPILQTERLTLGPTIFEASKPPYFSTVEADGAGYMAATIDAAGRVLEDALGEDGRTPDWILAAHKMRSAPLSDKSFPMDIIVGAGQSNIGSTPDPIIAAIDLEPVDPRIFLWSDTEGLVRFSDSANRRALTPRAILSFAKEYARTKLAPGRNVLIVNGGLGSTGFSTSSIVPPPAGYVAGGGTWDRTLTTDPNNLYARLVNWTNTAKGLAPAGSSLAALLISLGETDSDPGNKTQAQFATLLDDMIAQFRTDMAAPTLPVLIGSMVPAWTDETATRQAIAKAHEDTPRRVERSAYAWGPADLPDYSGNVHWSAQGQIARGPIFLSAYERARWNVATTEPVPPQNLTARRTGGTVLVSWEHPPCRIASFTLQYRIDGGAWNTVALTEATPRNATLALSLAPTSAIGLRISTTNSVGTSNYSREVQA